jgi:esterase/lipase superfamily enzyme
MLFRWLFGSFFLLAICLTSPAMTQVTPRIVSEPCRNAQDVSVRELDRKMILLRTTLDDLAKTRVKLAPDANAQRQDLDKKIRANQEALMDLTFALECYRRDLQDDPVLIQDAESRAGGTPPSRSPNRGEAQRVGTWAAITTYYATNREWIGKGDYGSNRTQRLEYGRAEVSIPTSRLPGELPLPTLWKLELKPDPNKHFILRNVEPLKGNAVRAQLRSALGSSDTRSVLLFVHGFNTTFTDVALRTAQLAHDLSFRGLPLFFSWPSAGSARSYFRDEEMAQLSVPQFNQLLDEIAALGATDVYVIAHSLGNRIVTNALKERTRRPIPKISELLLAAPDVNEQIFREQIVPALVAMKKTRRTIYASSNDVALKAANIAHGFRRVGDAAGGVLTFAGYDTVDVTQAAPIIRSYGHSYVLDSPRVLNDIADTFIHHKPITDRGLVQIPPNTFWSLR